MPSWKTLEAKDRLLAALVAAHPEKRLLDYRRIATYYGQGTTYDAIEGQFRIIRKEAERLRQAVESGEHAPAPPRGSSNGGAATKPKATFSKARAGKKSLSNNLSSTGGVISGRVTKSTSPPNFRKSASNKLTAVPTTGASITAQDLPPVSVTDSTSKTVHNKINGVKEENVSANNSVIEIEEDDNFDFIDEGLYNEQTTSFASNDWTVNFLEPVE